MLKGSAIGISTGTLAGCMNVMGGGTDDFKLGMALPLSQGWGPLGTGVQRAAELRVKEINENGGLSGQQIETAVEDTQVDPKTTAEVTEKLITRDNVDVLLGPINSANRNAMGSLLKEHEVPLIYPIIYEGPAGNDYCNQWIYKLGEIPALQIEPLVPWLNEEHGNSYYLLGADYTWPRATNSVMKDVVSETGGEVVGEDYVPLDQTDFTSIIPKIESADPDILFMTLVAPGVGSIQKQMANRGVREQWQDIHLAAGQGVLSGIPADAIEGLLSCHAYFENLDNTANNRFVSNFYDEYGDDALINYNSGLAYTGVEFLKQASDSADSTAMEDILPTMTEVSVDSVMGQTVDIPRDNQMNVGCTVAEVRDDLKYHPIAQLDKFEFADGCNDF